MNLERLIDAGEEKGFKVEQDIDFGAGPIDIVWNTTSTQLFQT
jgi:hypothetical protein